MIRRMSAVEVFEPSCHLSRDTERHGVHPDDEYLKRGRIPHIWCPGCGLGVVLNAFIQALKRNLPPRIPVVEKERHINDPAFARELVQALLDLSKR